MEDRVLGTTFHRTLPLKRSVLGSVISLVPKLDGEKLTKKQVIDKLKIGTAYAEAYPRYAKMGGLITPTLDKLSILGEFVVRYDSIIGNQMTMWLVHYHFCTPSGISPLFWKRIITEYFSPSNIFTEIELKNIIESTFYEQEGTIINSIGAISSVNIFKGVYTDFDAFGELRILFHPEGYSNSTLQVSTNRLTNPYVFAYALAHYWRTVHPGSASLGLAELANSPLARIFLLDPTETESMLEQLHHEGFVGITRVSPPYIVTLKKGEEEALELLYSDR